MIQEWIKLHLRRVEVVSLLIFKECRIVILGFCQAVRYSVTFIPSVRLVFKCVIFATRNCVPFTGYCNDCCRLYFLSDTVFMLANWWIEMITINKILRYSDQWQLTMHAFWRLYPIIGCIWRGVLLKIEIPGNPHSEGRKCIGFNNGIATRVARWS